eukprot:92808-Pelagomonas_calceolata.AAC.5
MARLDAAVSFPGTVAQQICDDLGLSGVLDGLTGMASLPVGPTGNLAAELAHACLCTNIPARGF